MALHDCIPRRDSFADFCFSSRCTCNLSSVLVSASSCCVENPHIGSFESCVYLWMENKYYPGACSSASMQVCLSNSLYPASSGISVSELPQGELILASFKTILPTLPLYWNWLLHLITHYGQQQQQLKISSTLPVMDFYISIKSMTTLFTIIYFVLLMWPLHNWSCRSSCTHGNTPASTLSLFHNRHSDLSYATFTSYHSHHNYKQRIWKNASLWFVISVRDLRNFLRLRHSRLVAVGVTPLV